jgi:ureidoglycolate lyase
MILKRFTKQDFQPFGDLIAPDAGGESANQGRAMKRSYLTSLINSRDHAKANVATFRVVGKSLPFPLVILEKHPYSSQMFIPFSSALKYLVIVALDKNDQPDLSTLTAFISDTSVGFNYKE